MIRFMGGGYYDELRSHRQATVWHRLNRLVLALIVLAAVVTVIAMFLPELQKMTEQNHRVEKLRGEIDGERMTLARRQREVKLLQHDPEYIEIIARDRLEVMKEGEIIVRLSPPPIDISGFQRQQQP